MFGKTLRRSESNTGLAKNAYLRYFLASLAQAAYEPVALLAPTAEILDAYRKKTISWEQYEAAYKAMLAVRGVQSLLSPGTLDWASLLCSEATPHRCHRRIAAEYLRKTVDADMMIVHL